MASEQFSLCWDNFHKNMSSGMNSLLENEDLVDVTLAVEGKYLKAHKMVLSVCSPYFRELFKVTPCKHPIVFMKDVSYVAMSDLLQFMYQGEVQVSQENLTTFIKTAEALQIKGLTGDGNGSAECDTEPIDEPKSQEPEVPKVMRPKKSHQLSPAPAPKRPRLSQPEPPPQAPPTVPAVTKTEPVNTSTTSNELIQFKMEPYDQGQSSVSITDETPDDNFGEDPLDETNADDGTEDYSMMEGGDEEPQAGTSAGEAAGEGQASSEESDVEAEDSLSEKSKEAYEKEYERFMNWVKLYNVEGFSENVFLSYFAEHALTMKPSSLWAKYSMLKFTMNKNDNVDLSKFPSLVSFLKRKSVGYKPKKSKTFTREDMIRFLTEAPDEVYLMKKITMILGIYGGCGRAELTRMKIDDIQDMDTILVVTVKDTKTKAERTFTVSHRLDNIDLIDLYRRYVALRPAKTEHRRLFVNYRNGKCSTQAVGINTFAKIPSLIAKWLQLSDYAGYTGHCFRRSAAAIIGRSWR